ncbi:Major facilitator superfamily domain-containing protein 4A [Halotydeus destructor]|nr:Major facilitator superfamily domain-containing protein 4A [Halotydeus destructor]
MGAIAQIKAHRIRFVKTLALYFALISIGLSISITGPTLIDLQLQTGTEYSEVSHVIPVRAVALSAGALIIGVIYDHVNPLLTISVCLLTTAIFNFYASLMTSINMLLVCSFIASVPQGMIDSGAVILLLNLWGKESPPFMHALHFFFGIGALIAPVLATPFLLPLQADSDDSTSAIFDMGFTASDVKVYWAYGAIAVLLVISSVIFFLLFIFYRETSPHPSRNGDPEIEANGLKPDYKMAVIVLTNLMMFTYVGLQTTIGTILTSFAFKSDLRLTTKTGATITTVFWSTFTFSRISAIFYIDLIGPLRNMTFCLVICLLSNDFLIPYGDTSPESLTIGVAILGLGLASMYATLIGYLEEHFKISSKVAGYIGLSAALGELAFPVIAGSYIDTFPNIFLYLSLLGTVLLCLIFLLISIICERYLHVNHIEDFRVPSNYETIDNDDTSKSD